MVKVKGGMSGGVGSMGLTMLDGIGLMGMGSMRLGLKGSGGGGMKAGSGTGSGTKDRGMGDGPGMSKFNIGGAGGGVKGGLDGALSSLVDDTMRAEGSGLSLEGHTKDWILSELKHLTDELVHLNGGGGEGEGGGDMKMNGG